jgi:phosphomannomutase
MIPWLLVAELLCVKNLKLSDAVAQRIKAYPSSGEINSKLENPKSAITRVLEKYQTDAVHVDHTDGISLEFNDTGGEWRFNLRSSNTEPVVRLNVESKGNITLMKIKTEEILTILRA